MASRTPQNGTGAGKAARPPKKANDTGSGTGVSPKGGASMTAKARFGAKGRSVKPQTISRSNTPASGPMKSRTSGVRRNGGR